MTRPLLPRLLIVLTVAGLVAGFPVHAEEDVAPVAARVAEDSHAITETPLEDVDREHWAFQPIRAVAVPEVQADAWPQSPLDRFVLATLERHAVPPTVPADRGTLLRRVTYDLVGLPPSVEDLTEFQNDPSPDAFERQLDRLLASPACGTRWAQHWLDLARFAETDGFEHDKVRPQSWQYRDWVVAALNENLPYDQFVQRQIAGDQSNPPDGATATMFCLSGPDMPDINDQSERRHLMLNELTSTVGAVFLGLQMGCAECHDHKYDPISQADFYRLRAVFESAIPELKRDVPWPRLIEQSDPRPARFWIRGDHRRPGPVIAAAFPRIASVHNEGDRPGPGESPRAALARWIVRPDHPPTARVLINRVWKHHFGRGLFETPSDVGLMNSPPSHPELLDWLARDFPRSGWDLKRLHRQLISTATYRQASRSSAADSYWNARREADPRNEWFGRAARRRLDGESLRDALLQIAGLLNDTPGGPGVLPPLPKELTGTLLKGQWPTSPRTADHDRRSLYIFARRNLRYPLFEAFDRPDGNGSCAVRGQSTTPLQSLQMLNSELTLRVARHLAAEIRTQSEDARQQIQTLYLRAFSRAATESEVVRLTEFLDRETARLEHAPDSEPGNARAAAEAAFVEVCLAVINASEMLYLD